MPEGGNANIEIAHHLGEAREERKEEASTIEHWMLETVEAIVLAIIAVATAWSGYQAALWTGHQAELYGNSTRLRVQAEGALNYATQERLYEAMSVSEWVRAEAQGQQKLADMFERRVLPEFRPAFEAWKQTDPLNNPDAPAGPQLMPQYRNAKAEEAARLNQQASDAFEQGNLARQHSDDYVRVTVLLATVLLLLAISQRFKIHAVRVGIVIVAVLLLCFPIYHIFTLPRA
jgi:hypothetical protein